ncbi:MAG: tetratricopeptide repeat protein, partial [Myxococcota bacterium]|nr:tetratricopeptide repeat protein [Myxococcota bacterium]
LDSTEVALDNVREALLLADREPTLAAERLERAHRAFPGDVALRTLYERMAPEPLLDGGAWREQRAAEATGNAQTLFLLDAAREYERLGDGEAALRCAEAAADAAGGMGRIARERAELRTGRVARLAEDLLAAAREAKDADERREAYARLAELDGSVRADAGSALLWHRAILEELPDHLPSLRHVEHHLIGEGRDEELEPIASAIARVLRGTGPGECTAHAEIAARLRSRGAEGSWEATREMAELAAGEAEPSLWSLRSLQAHARARGDDLTFLNVTLRLVDRAPQPPQTAALLVRAGEAAIRLERFDEARTLLERATTEAPDDIVAWELLVGVRRRAGDNVAAAEACESLARSSMVPAHQFAAWYEAARIWFDEVNDEGRAMVALETAAIIDAGQTDVFERLSSIYVSRKMQAELAALLERRLARVPDAADRLVMEVRRGQILLEVGDGEAARRAFESALADHPDDGAALSAFADLCLAQGDWETAEQALVRLARLLPTPEEQRSVYARLGDLYATHLLNLSRAEVAFNEVLKRAPGDAATMGKLVDIYRRQSDPARALPLQQQRIALSVPPEQKRDRLIELGVLYEQTAHDSRRAEQTFEAARREFPLDVAVLRASVEFYTRQRQPAMAEAVAYGAAEEGQRLLGLGRISPQLLDLVATMSDLRGDGGATAVTRAMLAALEGRTGAVRGAGSRAFDPGVDELLAPGVLSPALRALLRRAGHALDAVSPIDLRGLDAVGAPAASPLERLAAGIAHAMGLGNVQLLVSPRLGATCIPVRSSPPVILAGSVLAAGALDEEIVTFLVVRALKLVSAKAAALTRTAPAELGVLVGAWLKCFYPAFQPQGVDQAALRVAGSVLQGAMPRQSIPELRELAADVARNLGTHSASLGGNALAWANRVALLALGNPGAALDAIASSNGSAAGAPRDGTQRLAWVSMTAEVRDLLAFGAGPRFAEAHSRFNVSGA